MSPKASKPAGDPALSLTKPTRPKGKPFKKGHDARRSLTGGGRPPDEFRALMRECVSRQETVEQLRLILADRKSKHWAKAFALAVKLGYPELMADTVAGPQVVIVAPPVMTKEEWMRVYGGGVRQSEAAPFTEVVESRTAPRTLAAPAGEEREP